MKQVMVITLILMGIGTIAALPTYEELRAQVQEEANAIEQEAVQNFQKNYTPALIKIAISAFLSGIGLPLIVKTYQDDNFALASALSGLTALAIYATLLQHEELMADRDFVQKVHFAADNLFNTKMNYLHTRHYVHDTARFIMDRFEEIMKQYKGKTSDEI